MNKDAELLSDLKDWFANGRPRQHSNVKNTCLIIAEKLKQDKTVLLACIKQNENLVAKYKYVLSRLGVKVKFDVSYAKVYRSKWHADDYGNLVGIDNWVEDVFQGYSITLDNE